MGFIINYAHRGASGHCPENTLAAFAEAIDLGATGIETDVHMTKDGRLVLIHDASLKRTTGINAYVKDLTLDELKAADAGSWFHKDYKGETVPTLEELLDFVRTKDVMLNLELKSGIVQYPGLEEKTVETVRRYKMDDRVIISSFNHYSLVKVKQIAPEMKTGILYSEGLYEPWVYARRLGASALHAAHYAVLPEFVQAARAVDIDYTPFTVNDTGVMARLLAAGVAGIVTDYPDRLAALLSLKGS